MVYCGHGSCKYQSRSSLVVKQHKFNKHGIISDGIFECEKCDYKTYNYTQVCTRFFFQFLYLFNYIFI